jgi:hypothetical protein
VGRACQLVFQTDGNLVQYREGWTQPYWSTGTEGRGAGLHFAISPSMRHVEIWDSQLRLVFAH